MKFFKVVMMLALALAFSLSINNAPAYSQLGAEVLKVTPAELDFGTVVLDSSFSSFFAQAQLRFILKNTSNSDIVLKFSRSNQREFDVDTNLEFFEFLRPGQERQFIVTFDPARVGVYNDILEITAERILTTRNGRFVTEPISGFSTVVSFIGRAARPGLSFDANRLDFGAMDVRPNLLNAQFQISNPQTIDVRTISVTNTSDVTTRGTFSFVSNVFFLDTVLKSRGLISLRNEREYRRSFTLAAGESIEIGLVFLPDGVGLFSTTATLTFGNSFTDKQTMTISGIGQAGGLSVSPRNIDFGNIDMNDRPTQNIVLRNTGSRSLHVALTSFCSEYAVSDTNALRVLDPGETVTVAVTAFPSRLGALECQILVESDDVNSPRVQVSLDAQVSAARRSALGVGANAVQLSAEAGGFVLSSNDPNVAAMQLQVFDLHGSVIFDSTMTSGRQLRWQGLDNSGRPLANGVYLYMVTTEDVFGQTERSEIRKLSILR